MIEILLTQALVHQAQGSRPQALAALEHTLALAEPEWYLRTFVDKGEPIRLLLLDLQSSIEKGLGGRSLSFRQYVEELLSAFDGPVHKQSLASRGNSELIEPLSARELEILRLISLGHSNAEISQRAQPRGWRTHSSPSSPG